jgi:hypothetical protein
VVVWACLDGVTFASARGLTRGLARGLARGHARFGGVLSAPGLLACTPGRTNLGQARSLAERGVTRASGIST